MIFESGLGFVGILVAWLAGVSIHSRVQVTSPAIVRGLIACLPMLVLMLAASYSKWSPLVQLRNQVETLVSEMFGGSSWLELALICIAAGMGEELLFRGALQPWLGQLTGPTVAIIGIGLLFGLAHSLSKIYFVAATLIGCYLGWLTEAYDDLVAPIVAHAVYDFVAILFIRRGLNKPGSEP
ncbi:MAG: CPBP family intramembrane glutamic endopeptidase [Aeoliella sp.]